MIGRKQKVEEEIPDYKKKYMIEKKKKDLEWAKKYPRGEFIVQKRHFGEFTIYKNNVKKLVPAHNEFGLYLNFKRNTQFTTHKGIAVLVRRERGRDVIKNEDKQEDTWGKNYHFSNLYSMICKCEFLGVPSEAISVFVSRVKACDTKC